VTDKEKMQMLEAVISKLTSMIKGEMDFLKANGVGVTLLAFTFEPGALAYLSTATRETMVSALKEFIAYQDAGLTQEPPGERGKA